jgi:hypothetical protein
MYLHTYLYIKDLVQRLGGLRILEYEYVPSKSQTVIFIDRPRNNTPKQTSSRRSHAAPPGFVLMYSRQREMIQSDFSLPCGVY